MKKASLLLTFLLLATLSMVAQNVPAGMKYQAVARDANGEVLALKSVGLEIQLLAGGPDGKTAFSEVHQITTNNLGLFTITIGEGKNKSGILGEVPWSEYEIWMNVGLDPEGGEQFSTISTTKLLTVPYAFHAGTADQIGSGTGAEKTGPFWKVTGNSLTYENYHFIGTDDAKDLNFRTNDKERMEIDKDGDIFINNSLGIGANLDVGNDAHIGRDLDVDRNANIDFDVHIGQDLDVDRNANVDFDVTIGQDLFVDRDAEIGDDLTVKKNVNLNTEGGQTLNNGDFTVTNLKSTLLSGTLTVDLATDLNASLNVDGPSNLQSSLSVNNGSSTTLSGTLLVQDDATFNQQVLLDNPALSSTSVTTGGLVVNGGVGIGENLNVGGASAFGGPVDFAGAVSITDITESTSTTTGALKVTGGVGIGKRLNVGGATAVEDGTESTSSTSGAFKLSGGAGIVKRLNVGGITTVENTTESTSATNGALKVVGGAGIGKRLNVGGDNQSTSTTTGAVTVAGGVGIAKNLNVGGITKVDAVATGATAFIVRGSIAAGGGVTSNPQTTASQHIANFENTANGHGISIKVGAPIPHNKNNFITFYNSSNGTVGRIEGEDSDEGSGDFDRNREYKDTEAFAITDIAFATLDIVIAGLESVQASIDLAAAASSSTACAGLGVCITTPIPSLIIASIAEVALKVANIVSLGGNLAEASAALIVFRNTHKALEGITFASGAEDYAEYLPKLNPDEEFLPGDIVGVRNGYISKNTNGADMIMVVSLKPVVLGGLPPDGDVSGLEKVAFMGQVPTRIMGKVSPGDYILASGFNTGVGVAKSPDRMKSYDYKKILGVAWEGKDSEGIDFVNTAIGLNSNDMVDLYEKQNREIEALKDQIENTNDILAKLVPGFAEAANIETTDEAIDHDHDHAEHETSSVSAIEDQFLDHSSADQIVYFPIDREQLEAGLRLAEQNARRVYEQNGLDIMDHPFWNRLYTDPNYKEELFDNIKEELKYSFHSHQDINDRIIEKK